MEEQTELHFDKSIHWDIDALSIDFATWMAADDRNPAATSRVGILSSVECQRILHHHLDEDICTNLRLLVKTSSLLFSREDSPHPYYDSGQLNIIRSLVGAKSLKSLEPALKSTALANASQDKLKGLFLVLFGMIIAVTYTNKTVYEEARHELLRILIHHMILVGERIGLLDCDSTKYRLVENCHNLWNKVGNFQWNYENASRTDGANTDPFPQQEQSPLEVSPAASVSLNSARKSVNDESDPQRGDVSNTALADCDLHQLDPVHSAGSDAAVGPLPSYDLLHVSGFEFSSTPLDMSMTTCFLCSGIFPSDEMCPTCFGPFPVPASQYDVTLLDSFSLPSPVPAFDTMTANAEAFPILSGTDLWHSDTVVGSNERISEFSSGSPQMSRYHFRTRTPTEDVRPDVEDKSDRTKVRTGGTKRKRLDQIKKTAKRVTVVQKPTKHAKPPSQDSRKEPLSVINTCIRCCTMVGVNLTSTDFRPTKKCHHLQCSRCRISYTEPGFWGRGSWTCCRCQDGPKPTPPLPQKCENIYHPPISWPLLPLSSCCSGTALV